MNKTAKKNAKMISTKPFYPYSPYSARDVRWIRALLRWLWKIQILTSRFLLSKPKSYNYFPEYLPQFCEDFRRFVELRPKVSRMFAKDHRGRSEYVFQRFSVVTSTITWQVNYVIFYLCHANTIFLRGANSFKKPSVYAINLITASWDRGHTRNN